MTALTATAGPRHTRCGGLTIDRVMRIARPFGIAIGYVWLSLIYIPIVWLAVMSVSSRPLTGVPYPLSLEWYDALFSGNLRWWNPLERSLVLGVVVSILCMVAATMVGRALPQLRRRGGLLAAYLAPLFVPGLVTGVSMFMFYRAFIGVKLGNWSLILAHFVWAFPFALLAMLVVSSRFDIRMNEAASDLGATGWQRFWQIEVPLLRPGIIASGFFGFLLSFNELPLSIYMRAGQMTLPLHLWAESTAHQSSIPLIYGMSTLVTFVSIVIVVLALRLLFFRDAQQ